VEMGKLRGLRVVMMGTRIIKTDVHSSVRLKENRLIAILMELKKAPSNVMTTIL